MAEDPNKKVDQTDQPQPKQPSDDQNSNNVTISADDWKQMKSNMNHMNNTVHNLSTKLENVHKSDNQKPKQVNNSSHSDNTNNSDFKNKFNQLSKKYDDMSKKLTQRSNHENVIKHAKNTLKLNKMHVSPATFNHLLGADNRTTDANIDWFKGVYKAAHSRTPRFPHQSHHTDKKTTIGAQLAKDDKNNGTMRPINDCFKN